jgi:protein-disulfide isomerase
MDLQQLAAALQHEPYIQHLLLEIRQGMKLGIIGTPSYLINGSVYEGNIPAEILKPFLDGKS